LITEITPLDKSELQTSAFSYVSGSCPLGMIRLAGLVEAEATLVSAWQTGESESTSSREHYSALGKDLKFYLKLQPLLVRSDRLRLCLSLPDLQSQAHRPTWQAGFNYEKWTSPWFALDQTNPIEIEVPSLLHLTMGQELHWQVEETSALTPAEWVSSRITWRSLLGKMANSRYYLNQLYSVPTDGQTHEGPPSGLSQTPKTCFEMVNLSEQGIKLEVEGQRFSSDQIKLTLRLVSTGVTCEHDHTWLNRVYEVAVLDHEQQTLLPPTRLKVSQEQVLVLSLPEDLEEWLSLEFKLRQADH